MPNTVSNYGYLTGISPIVWSNMVQQPLYKQLVALKVCRTRLVDALGHGKAIQLPKFRDLTAGAYTPGTDISAQSQVWTYDTINVSTYQHVTFYVNHLRTLGETLLIKLRKLRENLTETIRSEALFGNVQRL